MAVVVILNRGAGATQLTMTVQPSTTDSSGAVLTTQPVVRIQAADGSFVDQADVTVTAAIATGSGVLSGTTTASTNASGQASFTDLVITGDGSYTLTFTASGLIAATSAAFGIGGVGAITAIVAGPWATAWGSVFGGDTVTLTASNCQSGLTVTLDGVAATDVVVVNDTTITAVAPSVIPAASAVSKTVDVVVTQNGVDTTLTNGFTYSYCPEMQLTAGQRIMKQDTFDRPTATITSGWSHFGQISAVAGINGQNCVRFNYDQGHATNFLDHSWFSENGGPAIDTVVTYSIRLSGDPSPDTVGLHGSGMKWCRLYRRIDTTPVHEFMECGAGRLTAPNTFTQFEHHDNSSSASPSIYHFTPVMPNPVTQNVTKAINWNTINDGVTWHRFTYHVYTGTNPNGLDGYAEWFIDGVLLGTTQGLGYGTDPEPVMRIQFPDNIVDTANTPTVVIDVQFFYAYDHAS